MSKSRVIEIHTIVPTDPDTVRRSLNRRLFEALNPPFPPVKVLRFDGTDKGGITHLSLNFFLFKQEWISENTESESGRDGAGFHFVDEGRKLPFFLAFWRHSHIFAEIPGDTELSFTRITDRIEYRGRGLMGLFLQPILILQFKYRKPVYRKIASGEFLS
ncbi:MAG: hypothetical protein KDK25_02410 [Leptospiraceae bacterium]|nr:hypothetical protein [Leptospiraceae bacterium]